LEACCDADPQGRPADAQELAQHLGQLAPSASAGSGPSREGAAPAKPQAPQSSAGASASRDTPSPRPAAPSMSDIYRQKKEKIAAVHAEARRRESDFDYAQAVQVLEQLPPEQRDGTLY